MKGIEDALQSFKGKVFSGWEINNNDEGIVFYFADGTFISVDACICQNTGYLEIKFS